MFLFFLKGVLICQDLGLQLAYIKNVVKSCLRVGSLECRIYIEVFNINSVSNSLHDKLILTKNSSERSSVIHCCLVKKIV